MSRNAFMTAISGFLMCFHIFVVQASLFIGTDPTHPIINSILWVAATVWFALEHDKEISNAERMLRRV